LQKFHEIERMLIAYAAHGVQGLRPIAERVRTDSVKVVMRMTFLLITDSIKAGVSKPIPNRYILNDLFPLDRPHNLPYKDLGDEPWNDPSGHEDETFPTASPHTAVKINGEVRCMYQRNLVPTAQIRITAVQDKTHGLEHLICETELDDKGYFLCSGNFIKKLITKLK
jgi:hypothetical protein